MKNISWILLFFFLTHLANDAEASAPGYLGKNFSIAYKGAANPIFLNESKNKVKGRVRFDVNFFHNFQLEYSISRRRSLSLQYERSRAGFTGTLKPIGSNQSDDEQWYFLNYRKNSFSFNANTSLRGAISPIGSYTSLGFYISRLTTIDPPEGSPNADIFESSNYGFYRYPQIWDYGIKFSYGRKFPLAKIILLDVGVETNLISRSLVVSVFGDEFTQLEGAGYDLLIRDYMHGIFKIYAGIHFLAF
ncbi:MAG: hypothetical protein EA412_10655 [Chitinophagaceae bacterium]|nr:MAG: hypothetical protein EA412_10655 [Chitinophagaceae bacterium]